MIQGRNDATAVQWAELVCDAPRSMKERVRSAFARSNMPRWTRKGWWRVFFGMLSALENPWAMAAMTDMQTCILFVIAQR